MASTTADSRHDPGASLSEVKPASAVDIDVEESNAGVATGSSRTPAVERLKGFAAGTASGATKLVIGHPFDTIKTRMQCSPIGTYAGPLDCLKQVIRGEGARSLYKGASPPAVGWAITDAILLGSLHNYRLLLAKHTNFKRPLDSTDPPGTSAKLSVLGHSLAGMLAGFTVAIAATPIELVKVQLQMQSLPSRQLFPVKSGSSPSAVAAMPPTAMASSIAKPAAYISPLGFAKQIHQHKGVFGFWYGVRSTMLQRMWFGAFFGSYDVMMRFFRTNIIHKDGTYGPWLKEGQANFIAGGMASNIFWIFAYPFDNVKNRIMCDSISSPKYPTWSSAAKAIWAEGRIKAVYRGFVPCILRAFPTNASALFVWETVMRFMEAEKVR